jgi:hypothetical protein
LEQLRQSDAACTTSSLCHTIWDYKELGPLAAQDAVSEVGGGFLVDLAFTVRIPEAYCDKRHASFLLFLIGKFVHHLCKCTPGDPLPFLTPAAVPIQGATTNNDLADLSPIGKDVEIQRTSSSSKLPHI